MPNVRLLHFAVLRELIGSEEERLLLPEGVSAGDVWQRLREQHPALSGYVKPPMIAVNETYVDAGEILRDGDELVFIPPVAGG